MMVIDNELVIGAAVDQLAEQLSTLVSLKFPHAMHSKIRSL